ncbi:MAG: hypothetical protein Q9191_002908 [Dirinaria sp. TL-2023a]
MRLWNLCMLAQLAALALAHLNKTRLAKNLDYLKEGLDTHLPPVNSTVYKWNSGWIPEDCKRHVEKRNLSAANFEIFDIYYDDCSIPWTVCKQNNSQQSLYDLVQNFGRVPAKARSWVRHVIDFSDPRSHVNSAATDNGTIMLFNHVDKGVTVYIHETGHALDGAAYSQKDLHLSKLWSDSYNNDSMVPDGYAGTNFNEDVAQVTVVATYNLNVPGGFQSVEPNWRNIYHQQTTLETEQRLAGNLLIRGGRCMQRVPASKPVPTMGGLSTTSLHNTTVTRKTKGNGRAVSNSRLVDDLKYVAS